MTQVLTEVIDMEDESVTGPLGRVQALEGAINTAFIEREDEATSLVVALIAVIEPTVQPIRPIARQIAQR